MGWMKMSLSLLLEATDKFEGWLPSRCLVALVPHRQVAIPGAPVRTVYMPVRVLGIRISVDAPEDVFLVAP